MNKAGSGNSTVGSPVVSSPHLDRSQGNILRLEPGEEEEEEEKEEKEDQTMKEVAQRDRLEPLR